MNVMQLKLVNAILGMALLVGHENYLPSSIAAHKGYSIIYHVVRPVLVTRTSFEESFI